MAILSSALNRSAEIPEIRSFMGYALPFQPVGHSVFGYGRQGPWFPEFQPRNETQSGWIKKAIEGGRIPSMALAMTGSKG